MAYTLSDELRNAIACGFGSNSWRSQTLDLSDHELRRRLDLFRRVEATEAEAEAGAGELVAAPIARRT